MSNYLSFVESVHDIRFFLLLVKKNFPISTSWLSLRTISGSALIVRTFPRNSLKWHWWPPSVIVEMSRFVRVIKTPVSWETSSFLSLHAPFPRLSIRVLFSVMILLSWPVFHNERSCAPVVIKVSLAWECWKFWCDSDTCIDAIPVAIEFLKLGRLLGCLMHLVRWMQLSAMVLKRHRRFELFI